MPLSEETERTCLWEITKSGDEKLMNEKEDFIHAGDAIQIKHAFSCFTLNENANFNDLHPPYVVVSLPPKNWIIKVSPISQSPNSMSFSLYGSHSLLADRTIF